MFLQRQQISASTSQKPELGKVTGQKPHKIGGGGTGKGQIKNIGNTLNGDYTAVHTDLTRSVSWQYLFTSVKFLCDSHVKNSTYLSETATNLSQKTDPPLYIH
jgi:hypothetical protein